LLLHRQGRLADRFKPRQDRDPDTRADGEGLEPVTAQHVASLLLD